MIAVHEKPALGEPSRVLATQRLDGLGEQGVDGAGIEPTEHLREPLLVERLPLAVLVVAALADQRGHPQPFQQGPILQQHAAEAAEALVAVEEAANRQRHQQRQRDVRVLARVGKRLDRQHPQAVTEGEEGIIPGWQGRLELRRLSPGPGQPPLPGRGTL